MNLYYKDFALGLKQVCYEKNINAHDLASALSIPIGTFNNWIQGRSEPPDYVKNLIFEEIYRLLYPEKC